MMKVNSEDEELSRCCTPPLVTPPCNVQSFNFLPAARPKLLRRQSSLSSVSSFNSDEGEQASLRGQGQSLQDSQPWTSEELVVLRGALEEYVELSNTRDTPFTGLPPSQLTHAMARAVLTKSDLDWKHSLKTTRAKILQLAKEKEVESQYDVSFDVEATPRVIQGRRHSTASDASGFGSDDEWSCAEVGMQADPEATPRRPTKRRKGLARQSSMDFLPIPATTGTLARLSDRLQDTHVPPYRIALPLGRSSSYSEGTPVLRDSMAFGSGENINLSYNNNEVQTSPRSSRSNSAAAFGGLVNLGPPSPTLSDSSTHSDASSLFSNYTASTKSTIGSAAFSINCNEYGYPTPVASARKTKRPSDSTPTQGHAKRPSLALEGRLSSLSLKRHHTADSLPISHVDIGLDLPDSPTPMNRNFLHPQPSIKSFHKEEEITLAPVMELDSPFHEAFPIDQKPFFA